MNYEILHFKRADDIPPDIKSEMINLVHDVYDDDTAQVFRDELGKKSNTYEYVVVFDKAKTTVLGLACMMNSGLDFDIWEFAWAMVRNGYRGIGIGKLLNDERIKIIKQYNGKKILCVTQKIWHLDRNGFHIAHTFANGDSLMVCEI